MDWLEYYNEKTCTLVVPKDYNDELVNLPVGIKILEFEKFSIFNKLIENLPSSITHITLETSFNQPVNEGILPNSLTHLTFGYYFNQPINQGILPNSLTHLTFGSYFNLPVSSLPNSLTHLTLGYFFDQPVDLLPNSLTHLTLGCYFNQSVDLIPSSVTHLTLSEYFDQSLKNLSSNIYYLGLHSTSHIKDDIPSSINTVKIYFRSDDDNYGCDETISNLPSTIKKIIVNDITKKHNITKIPFGCEIVEEKTDYYLEY
jgi:hypothetical protein